MHIDRFTMKIAVASGKGGTGKTLLAVNLALSVNTLSLLGLSPGQKSILQIPPFWDRRRAASCRRGRIG